MVVKYKNQDHFLFVVCSKCIYCKCIFVKQSGALGAMWFPGLDPGFLHARHVIYHLNPGPGA